MPLSLSIRQQTEADEHMMLSPYAAFSDESKGRAVPEEPCPLRACYQRDRDRIIHCKSFRRLKQKTQVFLSPEGDHYRTRLTHTLEVSQIARTIARALRLNEDLTEAIALGHDLGHTPFGHAGERVLNRLCPDGFHHFEQSVRVVTKLEKNGEGLNLTKEVIDGILNHTHGEWAATLEGRIVRYADRIAYVNHDIEDAITAGVLDENALPKDVIAVLGKTKSQRITTLITDIVENSESEIAMSPDIQEAYEALHSFMYSTVYVDKIAKKEEQKVDGIIEMLYEAISNDINLMPQDYMYIVWNEGVDRAVTDYISGMSDEYAVNMYEDLFIPQKWKVK